MRFMGFLLMIFASVAIAKDQVMIDPVEFMVSWPDLIGREVVITKGRVVGASDELMVLQLPGGNVILRPPWQDRDDLRLLFTKCTSLMTDDQCDVAASGTVAKTLSGQPSLVGVDFFKPAGQ